MGNAHTTNSQYTNQITESFQQRNITLNESISSNKSKRLTKIKMNKRKLSNEQLNQTQEQQLKQEQINKQQRNLKITISNTSRFINTWSILSISSIQDWKLYMAEKYNFDRVSCGFVCKGRYRETCTNGFCFYREGIYDLIYSSNSSLSKSSSSNGDKALLHFIKRLIHLSSHNKLTQEQGESKKMMEHFKYNHLPAMFSSFHHYNVNCLIKARDDGLFNENIILLSIYSEITIKTRFVLINLNTNKFLSIFGDYSGQLDTSNVYADWSYDCSRCLLKIIPLQHQQGLPIKAQIDLYDVSKKDGKLLNSFKLNNKSSIFSFFHTRFSKLVITSLTNDDEISIIGIEHKQNSLIQLKNSKQNFTNNISHGAIDLRISKDSAFMILTTSDSICSCNVLPTSNTEIKYLIFSASTCQLLKSYTSYLSVCVIHMCPSNYLPKLSKCQSRLALPNKKQQYTTYPIKRTPCSSKALIQHQNETTYIKLIQCPNEISLKNLCRIALLRQYSSQKEIISSLPVPYCLKSYLQYDPNFCC